MVAGQDSLYASAVIDASTKDLIIKIVNAADRLQPMVIDLVGGKKIAAKGLLTVLQSNDLNSVNSFDAPGNISPKESALIIKGKKINILAAPYSLNVIRVKQL